MAINQSKPAPNFPSLIESQWWIGFTDREGPVKWWNIFTKPNFRHVYMYAGAGEVVMVLTMTKGGLVVSTIKTSDLQNETIHEYLKKLYKAKVVVPARGLVASTVEIPRFAPFTCVELARSVLGVDKMIFTPYQLYKWILENRLAGEPL